MAINLLKVVKKTGVDLTKKTDGAKVDLTKPTDNIKEFTKNLDEWNKKTKDEIEECESKNEKSRPTKTNKKTTGSKKVQARPARPLKAKDVVRMAQKVMEQSPCGSVEYELVVGIASRIANITDWVQLVINILQDCVDIYQICYQYSDFSSEINETDGWVLMLEDLPFIGGSWFTDIFVWIIELLQNILSFPRKVVLFFSPLNEFLIVLIRILTMFKDEINRFIAAW